MAEQTPYLVFNNVGGMIIAPDWPSIAALYKKLHAVLESVPTVIKDKAQGQFGSVSIDNVAGQFSELFTKHGLAFTADMAQATRTGDLVSVTLALTLADIETGAMKVMHWTSEGKDADDRGPSMAATNALKTWLLRSFLVATEDKPHSTPPTAARRTAQPATAPAKIAPANVDKATGEISAPTQPGEAPPLTEADFDRPRQPFTITPPATDAPRGTKLKWFTDTTKGAGWGPQHTTNWLKIKHHVSSPTELQNGNLDAALTALAQQLSTPAA